MAARPPRRSLAGIRFRLALFIAAAALRPQLVVAGPLLAPMTIDLGLSHPVAGLLVSIPLLGMGICAPLGVALAGRYDTRLMLTWSLAAIGLAGLIRAVAPDGPTVLLATVPMAIAMGIGGALLPIVIKDRAAGQGMPSAVAYSFGIQIGSAITPLVATGIVAAGFGWRAALGAVALGVLVMAIGWLALARPTARTVSGGLHYRAVLRSRAAWRIAAAYAVLSVIYYGAIAWLPLTYVERGWDLGSAGALITLMTVSGLVSTVLTPGLSHALGGARRAATAAALLSIVAMALLATEPAAANLAAAAFGFGVGVVFTVILALPLVIAADPLEAGQISAVMLFVGYLVAAASPVGLGAIRDIVGTFSVSLWVLVLGACALPTLLWVNTPRPGSAARLPGQSGPSQARP